VAPTAQRVSDAHISGARSAVIRRTTAYNDNQEDANQMSTTKNMNAELLEILRGLIENWEDEVVEFKEASNSFKRDEIGEYFSAISNEANLKGLQYGWLVFGVNNQSRQVVGSDYRDTHGLETLDMNYTHILFDHPEYDLNTVFLLDKVQKHQEIGEVDAKYLRSRNLIDGRKPNLFVSAKYDDAGKGSIGDVASVTNNVTNRVTEINDTQSRIIESIRENPSITLAKLADVIGIAERNIKRNMKLLQDAGIVERVGSSRKGYWAISGDMEDES